MFRSVLAETEGAVDIARLLLDLLVVLGAAVLFGELAERIGTPAVTGEIVGGIIIGPSVLGWVELTGDRGVSIEVLAQVGVLLLLFLVGMEMDLIDLRRVGGVATAVAVIGVVVPFATGFGVALALGQETRPAVFIGAALTATSVGITARVFGDLGTLNADESRIVLGAAVVDDVLGLVILTVVVKSVTGGNVGVGTVLETLGLAALFLVGAGIVGLVIVPHFIRLVNRYAKGGSTLVVVSFMLILAFAAVADVTKLAFIIGAFMAGLALGRVDGHERIVTDLGAVGKIFIPVFFVSIGIAADLEAMIKPAVLGLAAALFVIAVIGKLVSAYGVGRMPVDKLTVGIGMVPRGEVGLIFASIGLANGVLDAEAYGALLLVLLLSTVVTPPLLRYRVTKVAAASPTDLVTDVHQ
jgi:Kef-type K+ transport system membrane component KefB